MLKKIKQFGNLFIKRPYHALFAVLIICFLVRSYRLEELFPFTMDEEYQAFLAADTLKNGHIPLIGVNVANTGLYLGPLFTWISTLLYWIGQGNPIITAWAAVFISLVTCWLLIKTIKIITSDQWLALIGGLLYALNPLIVMYDHKFWNPSLIMLVTIFWLYSLQKTIKNSYWWWAVGASLALALQFHYSLFILFAPTIWEIWSQFSLKKGKQKISTVKKIITKLVITFGLSLSPIILFELRHGFIQTKGLFQYLINGQAAAQPLWYKFWQLHAGLNRLWYMGFNQDLALEISLASQAKSTLLLPLSLIFILLLIYLYLSKKYWHFGKLYSIILISYILALFFFKSPISEYYFLPLFPLSLILIMLAMAKHIENRGIKAEYYLGAILALFLSIWSIQSLTLKNTLGLNSKILLINKIKNWVNKQPYELVAKGKYAYEGYRYLVYWQGITPTKSYMDGQFLWLYGGDNSIPELKITIYSKNETNLLELIKEDSFDKLDETARYIITSQQL